MNIENKTRDELIKSICEITGESTEEFNDWTIEELQEAALNL